VRLAELDDRRDRLRRERSDTGGRMEFWLRAPRSGRVASLGIVEGETVRPGRDLLTLLEPDARMDAVLLVPSRAVGFVRAGQQVRLLYDAFPYTRFGVHVAEVVRVGRSILAPSELGGPAAVREPVYKVRVRPRSDAVRARGERFPLQAGMALEADIQLERRPLWHWLLEPLLALEGRL
jgi:membrane fusion protein